MDEKQTGQTPAQPSKPARSKNALLRYLTILFAVAFLLVLLSYLIQMRNMNTTVAELGRTSSSALSNAERLQTTNQALMEEKSALEDQIDALEDQVDALGTELGAAQDSADAARREGETRAAGLETALGAQQQTYDDTLAAYETLAQAAAAHDRGDLETLRALLASLSGRTEFLGEQGAALYDALTAAAEAGTAENGAE